MSAAAASSTSPRSVASATRAGFGDGRVKTAAEEIVDLVSDLRHAMQAAPLPDKVAASLVSFDDFQAVFYEFLAAQKAFRANSPPASPQWCRPGRPTPSQIDTDARAQCFTPSLERYAAVCSDSALPASICGVKLGCSRDERAKRSPLHLRNGPKSGDF